MQDAFDQKKRAILKGIEETSEDTPDASPKGSIDEPCLPLINLINSHPDMVTTSSCSGRVSVFVEGKKEAQDGSGLVQVGSKGNEGHWLFVSHDANTTQDWLKHADFTFEIETVNQALIDNETRYILYKFEPYIFHVKCRDYNTANALYTAAMASGSRESGIGSNNNVAIRTSIRLDVPIGIYHEQTKSHILFVSQPYLHLLTKLSVDRFTENFRRMLALYKAIQNLTISKEADPKETREERRARKIREGLAKREISRAVKTENPTS